MFMYLTDQLLYVYEQSELMNIPYSAAKRQKIESVPVQPDPTTKRKSMDQSVSGQRPSSKRYVDSCFMSHRRFMTHSL